jgi:hypothetical protein
MPDTNPLAAANQTTEGKLSKVVTYAGIGVAVIAAVAESVSPFLSQIQDGASSRNWIGVILGLGGLLSAAATAVGLAISRSKVKAAMITAESPPMEPKQPN